MIIQYFIKMKEVVKHKSYWDVLSHAHPRIKKELLKHATKSQRKALIQMIVNIVRGNVPLSMNQKNNLKKHKNKLRKICNHCYNSKTNKVINRNIGKKTIDQIGGALPFLIAPILALIAKAALGGAVGAGTSYATKKIIDATSK